MSWFSYLQGNQETQEIEKLKKVFSGQKPCLARIDFRSDVVSRNRQIALLDATSNSMLERYVDIRVFNKLESLGYSPRLGQDSSYELKIALSQATKNLSEEHAGFPDVYIQGGDWVVVIENKGDMDKKVKMDSESSPFVEDFLSTKANDTKNYAENGAYYYLENIRDNWPGELRYAMAIGICMDGDECY